MMGALSNAASAGGAPVTGVAPQSVTGRGGSLSAAGDLVVTVDLGSRKTAMFARGYGACVTTADDIRRWATALPEVEEASHFRFHVPVFKVRGRTFLGMGKDETTAVFCISEQEADNAAAADPGSCAAVRRQDASRSFLGLQVELASVCGERIRCLVEEAWREQAPKRLAAGRDQSRPASP